MSFSPGDLVTAHVLAVEEVGGILRVLLSRRHADHRADRFWSHCELVVEVDPSDRETCPAPPVAGAEVRVVLASVGSAARPAEEPGYAFKLAPADRAPVMLPPRPVADGYHGGLVQREEPPAGGAVILHLGSGLTCYPILPDDPELLAAMGDGEWWELRFDQGHRALWIEPV